MIYFEEMCGVPRAMQFSKGKSVVPKAHIFPLQNNPKTLKNAWNEIGNHKSVRNEFKNHLTKMVWRMVYHRCCNLHSKFVLKRALLLSKRLKQQMVNIFNLLLGFIYFFGFNLILLLIFTLKRSYTVHFFIKRGSNNIFEGCRICRSNIFRYEGVSFCLFRSRTNKKFFWVLFWNFGRAH